ncbi:MBL fold metallo-hydrolase [bacterium]|nr:MBL fold metallo-hydrolase [bacterium]
MIRIKFFGVRGSLPISGDSYCRYGGKTTCLQITLDNGYSLIVDAGTGIVDLGDQIINKTDPLFIYFTHFHWDHIQGLPFFKPLYIPNQVIHFIANQPVGWNQNIVSQMNGKQFPVCFDQLPSDCLFHQFKSSTLELPPSMNMTAMAANHPGGYTIYKLTVDKQSIAICTDNELLATGPANQSMQDFAQQFNNCDVLIHDCQYLPEEMASKSGWGHSEYRSVCDLAAMANIKQLVLTHHDPCRTDQDIDEIRERINFYIKEKNYSFSITMAYEGLKLHVV